MKCSAEPLEREKVKGTETLDSASRDQFVLMDEAA